MIKSLLFDYGGTLDVPARHWAKVIWEAYQAYDVPITEQQFREAYVFAERHLATHPVIEPLDNFNILLHKKVELETEELVRLGHWRVKETKRASLSESIAAYCNDKVIAGLDNTRDILETLSKHYRLIIVSNFYGNLRTVMADYNLLPYFEYIVESAVVGVRKPSPEIWQLGVNASGYSASECCAIGDSYSKDITPATSLGCSTIWLKGETWKPEEQTENNVATHTISQLQELLPILT